MKDLDDILPLIDQYAPGCPVPAAYSAIRQSAIDFCEQTRLWRHEDDFMVTGEEAEGIAAPYGAVLLDIEQVLFDGVPLEPKTTAWLDERYPGWRTGTLTGSPRYLTQLEPNTIRLVPGAAGHVRVYARLKPAQDATELPDFMVDQYRETIAHGALARILLIPNQPFSNTASAGGFGSLFASKLASLSTAGSRGQQRARTRSKASFY